MTGRASPILTGISGEFFVAAELARRGYNAAITLRNTRGVDILASSADQSRHVGIQVKARWGPRRHWLVGRKALDRAADGLYFVFVILPSEPDRAPEFYVVPSAVVAERVKREYAEWLAEPGRGGRPHRDNPVRAFEDRVGEWRDRFDLLGLDTGVK